MTKVRNSNFELLRIISIIFIIFMHCTLFGFDLYNQQFSKNKAILDILFAGGKIGVNCFVLITGYFMIKSTITFKKVFKLIFQVWFYSVLIMLIGLLFMHKSLSINTFLSLIFPNIFGNYWFLTCYIVLYLLIPFINKTVLTFEKEFHKKILLALIILWSIFPTILFNAYVAYSDLGWFIVLYLLGGYIRLYHSSKDKFKQYFLRFLIWFGICLILTVGIDFLSTKLDYFKNSAPTLTSSTLAPYFVHFLNMNSLPLLLASIYLFLAFKNLNIKPSKIINTIASTTLGIYIIHEHIFVKYYIWQSIFKNKMYYYDIIHIIGSAFISVFIVFIVGCIIDLVRQKLIEKPVMKLFDKYYPSIKEKILNSKLYLKGKEIYEK